MSTTAFQYINGSMAFPAPFELDGARFNSFLYATDQKKLQDVCDKWFNIPSNGQVHYQPLLPVVLVTFADYQKSGPDVIPYKDWGYVKYREVIFSIFTVRLIKKGKVWLTDHVGALVPYIFVDDPLVMAAGREVYGMPKMMANIQIPEKLDGSTLPQFSIDTLSTLKFNPNTPFHNMPIAAIKQEKGSDEEKPPHRWKDMETAFKELKHLIFGGDHITLPDFKLLVEIEQIFLEQKLPFSSLRQLRSIDSSDTAAYQSIIDFYARMKRFDGAGLLHGNYPLELPENALFPIAEDLGLKNGQLADAAFWLEWDFNFETGTEVWNANEKSNSWELLREGFRGLFKF
jgi:hypothetical protein